MQEVNLLKHQQKVVFSTATDIEFYGGNGGGKTFAAMFKMYYFLKYNRNERGVYFSGMARRDLDQFLDYFKYEDWTVNYTTNSIVFDNGSCLMFMPFMKIG